MFITSLSLSYIFFGISIIALFFSLYFKILYIKTSPDNRSRTKILGSMKDPITWREKNNKMAYVSMFWALISISFFIYLKFFYKQGLVSIVYLFIYFGIIVLSIILFGSKQKAVD